MFYDVKMSVQLLFYDVRMSEDGGQQSVQLLDYQMRELEKYRTAVHKMGQDILTLRQQVNKILLASDVRDAMQVYGICNALIFNDLDSY